MKTLRARFAPFIDYLIWIGFGLAVLLATKPVWSFLVFGFNPTIDELLSIRCF